MVTVEIKGEGLVNEEVVGNTTSLTAIPDEDWLFKYFLNENAEIKDNPYLISDGNILAVFYYPIESYLRGKCGFDVPNYVMTSTRVSREIPKGADIDELSDRQKELAYADLLIWASTNPTTYSGEKDTDGGWSHQEASQTLTVADKKRFAEMANAIYKKYSDGKYAASIKIVNLR